MVRTNTRISTPVRVNPKRTRTVVKKKRQAPITKIMRCVGFVFPPLYDVDMAYSAQVPLSITTGAFNYYMFRANALYDPDYTGTGGQPLGFSQLSTIYDHYTVCSSSLEFTLSSSIAPNLTGCFNIAAYVDDDASVSTTMQQALQRPRVKALQMVTQTQGVTPVTKLYWSAATTYGNAKPWTDPEMQGTATSNPTEQSIYVIAIEDTNLNSSTVGIMVKMKFRVMWDELKTLTAT